MYTYNLIPTTPPTWVNIEGVLHEFASLDDRTLAAVGWLPLIYDPPDAPLGYADPVQETREGQEVAVAYALGTPEEREKAKAQNMRDDLTAQINAQVPQITATQQAIDPLASADVLRYASAATDRQLALQETPDAGLGEFDPTITVLRPGEDVLYSRLAVSITQQTPWAGAPNATLGFEAVLQPEPAHVEDGSQARLLVIAAPSDQGAVLDFVRSGDLWICRSRDGHKWSDEGAACSVQLLWGYGSLPVSPTLTCPGAFQRVACAVRYGEAVR